MQQAVKTRIFSSICVMYLHYFMVLSILSTVLPLYMNSLGYSESQIGFVVGVGAIASIFFTPLWGVIEDRIQNTPRMILCMSVMLFICALLFNVATEFVFFVLIRVLYEAFNCGIAPLIDKSALDVETTYDIPYSKMRIFGSIGYSVVLFPVIYLINRYQNYRIAFMAVALFILIIAVASQFMRNAQHVHVVETEQDEEGLAQSIKNLLRNRPYLIVAIIYTLIMATNDVMGVFQALHLQKTLLAPSYGISLAIFISAFVSEVPLMLIAHHLHRRINLYYCVFFGTVVFLFRYLLEALAPNWELFLAIKLLHGISIVLIWSPILLLIRRHVAKKIFTSAIMIAIGLKALVTAILSVAVGSVNDWAQTTYGMYYVVIPLLGIAVGLLIYYYKFHYILKKP